MAPARNGYIIGNVAYTEDNITVYTLYASNLPTNITEHDLRQHFSKFGEVKTIQIIRKKTDRPFGNATKSQFCYAFINFESPFSATRALKSPSHKFQNKMIFVKIADSWKQPKTDETAGPSGLLQLPNQNNPSDESNQQNELPPPNQILKLNDDCLLHIFSFLPMRDKIHMTEVCERFASLFEIEFRAKKKLDLSTLEDLTLMEIRQIMHNVGHLIHMISFSSSHLRRNQQRFLEFLPNFCENLHTLELNNIIKIRSDLYDRLSRNLKSLKHLSLVKCNVTDHSLALLSNLTEIETLDLKENIEITGKHISKFVKLETLNLNCCFNIHPTHFNEITTNLKNTLKSLSIVLCTRLNKDSFQNIIDNLINLESLTISTNRNTELENINEMKKLKALTLYSSSLKDEAIINLTNNENPILQTLSIYGGKMNQVKMEALKQLNSLIELRLPWDSEINDDLLIGISKWDSLKHLNIVNSSKITKSGLIELIRRSPNIEIINISLCRQFDNDTIYEIIDTIKQKRRTKPYKIIVNKTNIHQNILEDKKFQENNSLLQLSWEKVDHEEKQPSNSYFNYIMDSESSSDEDFDQLFEDELYDLYGLDDNDSDDDDDYDDYDDDDDDDIDDYSVYIEITFSQ